MKVTDKVLVSGLEGVFVITELSGDSATVRPSRRGRPKFTTVSVSLLTLAPIPAATGTSSDVAA